MKTWIDEVESRAEAATPGPWDAETIGGGVRHLEKNVDDYTAPDGFNLPGRQSGDGGKRDGDFIATARTDVPRLCKALRMTLDAAVCTCGVRGSMFGHDDKDETCPATVAERIRKGDF